MSSKTIVIACVPPALTAAQEAGMLRLLHDVESRGVRAVFYSPHLYPAFGRYQAGPQRYSRATYKYYFYKTWLLMDRPKWLARFMAYHALTDAPAARAEMRRQLKGAVRYLCSVRPQAYISWNPNSAANGLFAVAAGYMGIKTAAIEWGFLPDSYILDRGGTLASSTLFNRPVSYPNPAALLREGERIFTELKQHTLSLYAQENRELPAALTAGGAGHTRVLVLGIHLIDSGTWPAGHPDSRGLLPFHQSSFEQAEALAGADPDFRVIYKPHPKHNAHPHNRQALPNLWIINANPDQLIAWADVVVCSSSKMELSALLNHKPLVTIGAGLLHQKGCTYEVSRPAQMRGKVQEAGQHGVTRAQLQCFKQFLGYLSLHYLYIYDERHSNAEVVDALLKSLD